MIQHEVIDVTELYDEAKFNTCEEIRKKAHGVILRPGNLYMLKDDYLKYQKSKMLYLSLIKKYNSSTTNPGTGKEETKAKKKVKPMRRISSGSWKNLLKNSTPRLSLT